MVEAGKRYRTPDGYTYRVLRCEPLMNSRMWWVQPDEMPGVCWPEATMTADVEVE